MKNLLMFIGCVVLAISCSRCKEDCDDATNPDCPNYVAPDPCANSREVIADFDITESLFIDADTYWIPTDTIVNNNRARFQASIDNAIEYKWYIGSQTYTGRSVVLWFQEQWANTNIPITLVVRKQPDSLCFPEDDGYDSLTKVMHVSQYAIYPGQNQIGPVIHGSLGGTYRMKGEHLADSIDINVDFCFFGGPVKINFNNLDGNGTVCSCNFDNVGDRAVRAWSYRELRFGMSGGGVPVGTDFCNVVFGYLRRTDNANVELGYQTNLWPFPQGPITTTDYKLRGRKIQ